MILLHGYPETKASWDDVVPGLTAAGYRVLAPDQRGYGESDAPQAIDAYNLCHLSSDIVGLVYGLGESRATIVGHDWGGLVAWQVALNAPQFVDRLIILNLPHPRGIGRELAHNPKQQAASEYARNFQKEGAENLIKPEQLAFWVTDPEAKPKYIEAFKRSDLKAMLSYYKRNYPRQPYQEDPSPVVKTQMPVLMFHGLKDPALLSDALNNTWDWMGKDLTLVTIPDAGHFVQQDAADLVTRSMRAWLDR